MGVGFYLGKYNYFSEEDSILSFLSSFASSLSSPYQSFSTESLSVSLFRLFEFTIFSSFPLVNLIKFLPLCWGPAIVDLRLAVGPQLPSKPWPGCPPPSKRSQAIASPNWPALWPGLWTATALSRQEREERGRERGEPKDEGAAAAAAAAADQTDIIWEDSKAYLWRGSHILKSHYNNNNNNNKILILILILILLSW